MLRSESNSVRFRIRRSNIRGVQAPSVPFTPEKKNRKKEKTTTTTVWTGHLFLGISRTDLWSQVNFKSLITKKNVFLRN